MLQLPQNMDFEEAWEGAMGTSIRHVPRWAPARDPLFGQPQRQDAREAAVAAIWGPLDQVWADILHQTGRGRFIPGFQMYLSFQ